MSVPSFSLSLSLSHTHALPVTAPRITTPPMDMEGAFPDTEVSFSVVAEGGALSYQWFRNDEEISGATQLAMLTLTNVNIEMDKGMYRCFMSNLAGNVTTNNVSLTICKYTYIHTLCIHVLYGCIIVRMHISIIFENI